MRYAAVARRRVTKLEELTPRQQKLKTVRTPDQQAALMRGYADTGDIQRQILSSCQPKTPEAAKLSSDLHQGTSQLTQTAHDWMHGCVKKESPIASEPLAKPAAAWARNHLFSDLQPTWHPAASRLQPAARLRDTPSD